MALRPTDSRTADEKKAAQDDVLKREIDDAVRQDQYSEFAKRYGKPLIGVLVVGLAAFGGYLWWDARQEAELERNSEALIGAMDQIEAGNLDTGAAALEPLIADAGTDVAVFASMLKAGIALEQDRPEEAAQIFAGLAASDDTPPALRDLATIREIAATYDSREPQEIIDRLRPLAVPGNAFFGSAGELVAMAYLEQGKRAEAGTLFAEIAKAEDVPEGLRSRARQMAGQLGVDAIEDVDELLEDIGAGDDAATADGQ